MQFQLVFYTDVLSDVGFKLPHDFLINLWGSLYAGEVRTLGGDNRLRLGLTWVGLNFRLINVAAL